MMQQSRIGLLSARDAAVKDRREAQAGGGACPDSQACINTQLLNHKLDGHEEENHMVRLYTPRKMYELVFMRRVLWPQLDDKDVAFMNACWDNAISKETFEARALYLKHVLIAERMVADTHCCFVCPMEKRVMLPEKDTSGCNLSEFKECMRDPVMASDGHSYERRNIEKWVREKGKKAKSPMTSAVLAPSVSSNKTLKFAINEAVDRQLLEMMERDPRVKSDIEVACRLLLQENAPDTPEQAGSNPAKRQRVTDSGSV
jgi:hypothetical protein